MKTDILKIGNLRFARNGKAVVETLFQAGGTASGTFKKSKRKIQFYDLQGKPWFALIENKYGETFFVSTGVLRDGRIFYLHALDSSTEEQIGITSYKAKCELAESVWGTINNQN